MTIAIRHSKDVEERLVGHRVKCGGRFEVRVEVSKLAWRWVCGCGYEGLMGLSTVKAGKFGWWVDIGRKGYMRMMEMRVI